MSGSSPSTVKDKKILPKLYEPREIEPKWQKFWQRREIYKLAYKFNKNDTSRPPFVIDTPPPFTSGELHMGHAYWNSINDTIARYKRMRGFNVLLPQGWDCQGLPTELKVQYKWKIPRENREVFRQKCREWTEEMIDRMKSTMTKLGYRPDLEQFEYKTMDLSYWKAVQATLLEFYERGLIYRAEFPIHWCPKCETALAQAELGYEVEEAYLYYIKFELERGSLEVATTRPELLSSCQALLVHPEDDRYTHFIGKEATVPIFGKKISILADPKVDPKFGTGVVMICTFGDEQDIRWQQKYNLPISKVVDERGNIINSGKYTGFSIPNVRKMIVADLQNMGFLPKQERLFHKVLCHTERSDCMSPIEFLIKKQWFIKIKPFKEDVINACKNMGWIPQYMFQRLIDWVNSVEWDWLISRQRAYGTPLPFWYCDDCDQIIPAHPKQIPIDPTKEKPPIKKCPKCGSTNIKATEDVCDCWVDSSITPLIISGYFKREPRFNRTYPADLREQGHDIIRTWLFYTVIRCLIITKKEPFKEVLINGHILGPDGHRMSKSRGNVVNPEERLEIYGADSLRQALLSLLIGSDFPFRWETVKYGKGFLQKYWSASRFAQPFLRNYVPSAKNATHLTVIDRWILAKLAEAIKKISDSLDSYQFHIAVETIQNFFWHAFCDQYLEAVKHRLYLKTDEETKRAAQYTLYAVLLNTTIMLAPICPHATEEVHHQLFEEETKLPTIHAASWPDITKIPLDKNAEVQGNIIIDTIAKMRSEKARAGIPLSMPIEQFTIEAPEETLSVLREFEEDIKKILHFKKIRCQKGKIFKTRIG